MTWCRQIQSRAIPACVLTFACGRLVLVVAECTCATVLSPIQFFAIVHSSVTESARWSQSPGSIAFVCDIAIA